ncbi:MAG: HD domain-containing protein [Nitrospirae bacterium]|nr:HD domain-containing protein [Nitrospirota bacterium]
MRLTDLIRGAKIPPEEPEKESPASETPPAPAPSQPIQLRTLKERVQREAPTSEVPSQPSVPTSTASPVPPSSVSLAGVLEEPAPPPQAPVSSAVPPAADWYIKAETALLAIAKSIRTQQPFSLGDLPQIASGIATSLAQDDMLLVRAISHQSGPSLVGNLVHTAIFAVKIGMGMGYRSDELSRLALAALVHDFGMFLLPERMLDEAGRWSKDQIDLLRSHPIQGAELLRRAAPDELWLSEIVMQEHERVDGTGYPKGLKGPQIHEMALVIGMADVLDAMLRTRLNRKALLPHEAVRLLLARERPGFPTRAFKSLLNQFSLFPAGTWVKLSSGDVGVVVQSTPRFPLRPIVKVMLDQAGLRLREPREIDLCKTPLISVLEIVDRL